MNEFVTARHAMVESQIRTVRVTDKAVIAAFRNVPREVFLPDDMQPFAYCDGDLRISTGKHMIKPMVQARLLQASELKPSDAVLVIGCATGYLVALVAKIAATVVGLEDDPELVSRADRALASLDIDNGVVVLGDLTAGFPKLAPYDIIIIEGCCGRIPDRVTEQLAPGGRLLAVVDENGVGKASVFRRNVDGEIGRRVLFDAGVPDLGTFSDEPVFRL